MKIVKAVCPHCGAEIKVKPGTEIMNCIYCDMQIDCSDLELKEEDVPDREAAFYEEQNIPAPSTGDAPFPEPGRENRNRSKDSAADPASPGHGYWTPVGFRSRNTINMVIAGLYYARLVFRLVTAESFLEGILSAALNLFIIGILFSWQPFVDHLPGIRKDIETGKKTMRAVYIVIAVAIYLSLNWRTSLL